MPKIVVAITGSSAPIYGISTLQALAANPDVETHLVLSEGARASIQYEALGWTVDKIAALATVVHDSRNMAASISSGSFKTEGMVVVPCSMKTLSAIANGYSSDLVSRAADVCLKERRPLVIVPRETPLNRAHLVNMLAVNDMGGVVLPPVPGFYGHPETIQDLVDHTVGKVLDILGVPHQLFQRWRGSDSVNVEIDRGKTP